MVLPVSSRGLKVIDAMDRPGKSSIRGVQLGEAALALVVRQMPPLTEPIKTVLAWVGWGAMVRMAPATGLSVMPSTWPLRSGPGPCSTQLGTPVRLTAKSVRSSSCSTFHVQLGADLEATRHLLRAAADRWRPGCRKANHCENTITRSPVKREMSTSRCFRFRV